MRINEVRDRKVDVTLDADELVLMGNIMHFYEKNIQAQEPDSREPNAKFHEMNASVIIARDLCQYGNLDTFSIKHMVRHKIAANPGTGLAKFCEALKKEEEGKDGQ